LANSKGKIFNGGTYLRSNAIGHQRGAGEAILLNIAQGAVFTQYPVVKEQKSELF
jgi:hypothetical protein